MSYEDIRRLSQRLPGKRPKAKVDVTRLPRVSKTFSFRSGLNSLSKPKINEPVKRPSIINASHLSGFEPRLDRRPNLYDLAKPLGLSYASSANRGFDRMERQLKVDGPVKLPRIVTQTTGSEYSDLQKLEKRRRSEEPLFLPEIKKTDTKTDNRRKEEDYIPYHIPSLTETESYDAGFHHRHLPRVDSAGSRVIRIEEDFPHELFRTTVVLGSTPSQHHEVPVSRDGSIFDKYKKLPGITATVSTSNIESPPHTTTSANDRRSGMRSGRMDTYTPYSYEPSDGMETPQLSHESEFFGPDDLMPSITPLEIHKPIIPVLVLNPNNPLIVRNPPRKGCQLDSVHLPSMPAGHASVKGTSTPSPDMATLMPTVLGLNKKIPRPPTGPCPRAKTARPIRRHIYVKDNSANCIEEQHQDRHRQQ